MNELFKDEFGKMKKMDYGAEAKENMQKWIDELDFDSPYMLFTWDQERNWSMLPGYIQYQTDESWKRFREACHDALDAAFNSIEIQYRKKKVEES